MIPGKVGRPRRPVAISRHTLILATDATERLSRMRAAFEKRWGAAPTVSVLVARALEHAERAAVEDPPERERLLTATAQFRKLKAAAANAKSMNRKALFPIWAELVQVLQRTNEIRNDITRHRRDWPGWAGAQASAGQLITEIGQVQDAIAGVMKVLS